jgi:hypothetical protein
MSYILNQFKFQNGRNRIIKFESYQCYVRNANVAGMLDIYVIRLIKWTHDVIFFPITNFNSKTTEFSYRWSTLKDAAQFLFCIDSI